MSPPPESFAQLPKARIHFRAWSDFAAFLTQGGGEGLFVRTGKPPAIGTELRLEFVFPDRSDMSLRARVISRATAEQAGSQGAEAGMWLQFTDMSEEQAARLQALIARADVARGIAAAQGRSLPPVTAPPSRPPSPTTDAERRLVEAYGLLERSRFDVAERLAVELMAEDPSEAHRVLLLVVQARRLASQFDFEGALRKYGAVLETTPEHKEAQEQVRLLHAELAHSADLFKRVFGS